MDKQAEHARVYYTVARVDVHLPAVHSLKEKRALLKPITSTLVKMGASVTEVGAQNRWQRAVLGVAFASSSPSALEQFLAEIVRVVERDPRVTVVAIDDIIDDLGP